MVSSLSLNHVPALLCRQRLYRRTPAALADNTIFFIVYIFFCLVKSF